MLKGKSHRSREEARCHVLIQIENLPLGRDGRVKREARALLDAGYDVTVVCPRSLARDGPVDQRIRLLDYAAPPAIGSGVFAYLVEYTWSLIFTLINTTRAHLSQKVDIIQSCNPPDLNFLVNWAFVKLGAKFVFDQHDPSPEVFSARYGGRKGLLHQVLIRLEQLSYAVADHIVTANDSLKDLAVTRGRQPECKVTVVSNAPWMDDIRESKGFSERREENPSLCVWLGVMGPDDGVDMILRAAAELQAMGRTDVRIALIGDGEGRSENEALARDLAVTSMVEFVGWLAYQDALQYLSSAVLGLAAEPPNELSRLCSMMKVMDYMAAGMPVVAFDVQSTRRSAASAGAYADEHTPAAYAALIAALLDDPGRRAGMAQAGRERFEVEFAWDHQQKKYLSVFEQLRVLRR